MTREEFIEQVDVDTTREADGYLRVTFSLGGWQTHRTLDNLSLQPSVRVMTFNVTMQDVYLEYIKNEVG